jgi:hypothetical protein
MNDFWQGLGGKLTDQWVAILLTPAFAFWLGGFFAWLTHSGWNELKTLETQLKQLTLVEFIVLLIIILLVIAVSSSLVQRFNFAMLRGLEGYWPTWLDWLANRCKQLRKSSQDKIVQKYEELDNKDELSPEEEKMRVELALKKRRFPRNPDERMPLQLGNILRASENRSWEKYGLDAILCWPRLWLLLPDASQKALAEARATLDSAVLLFLWSLLFLFWTVWAWWVPLVTLVVAIWSYRWALSAAQVYVDLLEAAFDLYRFSLYGAVHFPPPENTSVEVEKGIQLTTYLYYGMLDEPVTFQKASGTRQEQQTESKP